MEEFFTISFSFSLMKWSNENFNLKQHWSKYCVSSGQLFSSIPCVYLQSVTWGREVKAEIRALVFQC